MCVCRSETAKKSLRMVNTCSTLYLVLAPDKKCVVKHKNIRPKLVDRQMIQRRMNISGVYDEMCMVWSVWRPILCVCVFASSVWEGRVRNISRVKLKNDQSNDSISGWVRESEYSSTNTSRGDVEIWQQKNEGWYIDPSSHSPIVFHNLLVCLSPSLFIWSLALRTGISNWNAERGQFWK